MKKTTSHYRHLFFLMFSGNPCIYIGGGEVDGGEVADDYKLAYFRKHV